MPFETDRTDLESIARVIASREERVHKLGQETRKKMGEFFTVPREVVARELSGIDGGFGSIHWHGLDILLVRTVSVTMSRHGRDTVWSYHPSRAPPVEHHLVDRASIDHEVALYASMLRTLREVERVRETVERANEEQVVFWDGSVLPHPSLRRLSTDFTRPIYKRMLEEYARLYKTIEEKRVLLAGVVEDSRSNAFWRHAHEEYGVGRDEDWISDTALLYHALKPREATRPLPAIESYPGWEPGEDTPDVGARSLASRVYYYYQKPSMGDRPVRIEFVVPKKDGLEGCWERVSGVIAHECRSRAYPLPPVLVEADLRAKISSEEREMVETRLRRGMARNGYLEGGLSAPLRRDKRPF